MFFHRVLEPGGREFTEHGVKFSVSPVPTGDVTNGLILVSVDMTKGHVNVSPPGEYIITCSREFDDPAKHPRFKPRDPRQNYLNLRKGKWNT